MKARASRPSSKKAGENATLSVRIQPRSSKNEILRMEDRTIKIKLTAPPVNGAANEALVRFLADTFFVSKSQVEIISGHTSRDKIVRIDGVEQAKVDQMLNKAVK